MPSSTKKLDQALIDLASAYSELETQLTEKHGDDQEALAGALVEVLEAAIDTALEEEGISTGRFASMLTAVTEALEQIDPSAFDEGGEEEYEYDIDDSDIDLDDDDDDEDDLEEDDEDE